jgi:hypothetical protein
MADMDREVIIPPYNKFWSRIEAVMYASGNFIKLKLYVIHIYTFPEI